MRLKAFTHDANNRLEFALADSQKRCAFARSSVAASGTEMKYHDCRTSSLTRVPAGKWRECTTSRSRPYRRGEAPISRLNAVLKALSDS